MASRSARVDVRLGKRGANHGNNGAEMLAAGQLRHHAAIARMRRDLRSDDGGNCACAPLHNRRGGFVARAFNAENEAGAGHILSVLCSAGLQTGCSADLQIRTRPKIVTTPLGSNRPSRARADGSRIEH